MSVNYLHLATYNLETHGDSRERVLWSTMRDRLPEYETLWREFIVLLTNRVNPAVPCDCEQWIRIRDDVRPELETIAMASYSAFYFLGRAWAEVQQEVGKMPIVDSFCPEDVFALLDSSAENRRGLLMASKKFLSKWTLWNDSLCRCEQKPTCLRAIRDYRNAFLHNPVLGRAASRSRELIPKPEIVKQVCRSWRKASQLPESKLVDVREKENDLWNELADHMRGCWRSLAETFISARQVEEFPKLLGIESFFPIRPAPKSEFNVTNRYAASRSNFVP